MLLLTVSVQSASADLTESTTSRWMLLVCLHKKANETVETNLVAFSL